MRTSKCIVSQADLSLYLAHMPEGVFSQLAAQISHGYMLLCFRYLKFTSWLNANPMVLYITVWTARWLCYFNSAVNPVIYNFMSSKYTSLYVFHCHGR